MRKPVFFSALGASIGLTFALSTLGAPFAYAEPKDTKEAPKTTTAPPPEKVSKAKELSEAVISVAERVSPSVVQIDVTVRDESAESA
jgi:hypothetical protein